MTALPNQVKDTWDVNMDMTSTFTCGYGYIKWRNVTKEDELVLREMPILPLIFRCSAQQMPI